MLGIEHLEMASVKAWVLTHLDRAHFYVPAGHDLVRKMLEFYIRARGKWFLRGIGTSGTAKARLYVVL